MQLALEVKCDLLKSSLIPKVGKCIWDPVQEMEWLGACLNTYQFYISIPERRINKALGMIELLKSTNFVPVRKLASFIGQIFFYEHRYWPSSKNYDKIFEY